MARAAIDVLIISGAHRADGNTERMTRHIVQACSRYGLRVSAVPLRMKRIHYCTGCASCETTGRCIIKDDMQPLYGMLMRTRIVVIVTPLYFFSVSSRMKTFIDRCQPLYARRFILKDIKDEAGRIGIIASCGATQKKHRFSGTALTADFFFRSIGIRNMRTLFLTGIEDQGDIETVTAIEKRIGALFTR